VGGDEGANGRGGRLFSAIEGVGGLLCDEDTGTVGGPFRVMDRSVHDLTLSLTLTPKFGFVDSGSRNVSRLCCTLR